MSFVVNILIISIILRSAAGIRAMFRLFESEIASVAALTRNDRKGRTEVRTPGYLRNLFLTFVIFVYFVVKFFRGLPYLVYNPGKSVV